MSALQLAHIQVGQGNSANRYLNVSGEQATGRVPQLVPPLTRSVSTGQVISRSRTSLIFARRQPGSRSTRLQWSRLRAGCRALHRCGEAGPELAQVLQVQCRLHDWNAVNCVVPAGSANVVWACVSMPRVYSFQPMITPLESLM